VPVGAGAVDVEVVPGEGFSPWDGAADSLVEEVDELSEAGREEEPEERLSVL
jgi:hypothetical protein